MKSKKNGKIEILRFLFATIILMFHGRLLVSESSKLFFPTGGLAVEFFFLVSGYLMMMNVSKKVANTKDGENMKLGEMTKDFIWRKYCGLYPMVAIVWFTYLGAQVIVKDMNFRQSVVKFLQGIPCLFLIQQTGIQWYTINGTWYISSMLIAFAILYPLCFKYHDFMKNVGLLLIAGFSLGYLFHASGVLGTPDQLAGITYCGNYRALGEISLGAYMGAWLPVVLKDKKFSKLSKALLSLSEAGLYILALYYMNHHKASNYDYLILMLLVGAVSISFSGKTLFSDLWNNKICYFLGKLSMYIYLVHLTVRICVIDILPSEWSNLQRMLVFMILSYLAAVLLWVVSDFLRNIFNRIKASDIWFEK